METLRGVTARSASGQEGYVDCFRGLTRSAREWLEAGRTFGEFVAWMEATERLLPAGSWSLGGADDGSVDA